MTLLLWIGGAFVVACLAWNLVDALNAQAEADYSSPEAKAKRDAQRDVIMAAFYRREAAREARENQEAAA